MESKKDSLAALSTRADKIVAAVAVFWTLFIAVLAVWDVQVHRRAATAIAKAGLLEAYQKDVVYRLWASFHGGVYVPVTARTQPNPYLSHIPERDITTNSGRLLTLMNPAYMTRQVQELSEKLYGHKSHITSLNPLRPENQPDEWERKALLAFQNGANEIWDFEPIDGEMYLRFMRPFKVEEGCLRCHVGEGLKIGDVRGGISVSAKWVPYENAIQDQYWRHAMMYSAIWLLGIIGLYMARRGLKSGLSRSVIAEQRLAESEERYRSLCEHMRDAVAVCRAVDDGEDFIFVQVNKAMEDIEKVSRQDIIGKSLQAIFPGTKEFGIFYAFQRVWRTGKPEHFPVSEYRDNRITGWRDNFVYRLPSGEIVAVYSDQTEQKQIEEALKDSERRWQFAVEGSGDGLWDWIVPENKVFYSRQWKAMLGYEEAEIGDGLDEWDKRVHPDDKDRCYADLTKHFQGQTPEYRNEHRLRCKDGTYKWILDRGKVFEWTDDGGPYRIIGTHTDITERKVALEELRRQKERFQVLTENAPFGMMLVQQDGAITYVNPKFTEIFGYELHDIKTGREWFRRAYPNPSYRRGVIKAWLEDRDHAPMGESRPRVFTVTCKDGTEKIIHFRPVKLHSGEDIASCEDVTYQKRAEEERLEMERRLMYTQKLESLGLMAGGIAHDFNNLLQAVMGNLELAQMRMEARAPSRENVKRALDTAHRCVDLSKKMLAYSGRTPFTPKDIDVNHIIEINRHILSSMIPKKAAINLKLSKQVPNISGDADQLYEVLTNLVTNASESLSEGAGDIEIATYVNSFDAEALQFNRLMDNPPPGTYVVLEVRDTGSGMDAETLDHLFDPFFTTKFVGRGLGMSVVMGVVKGHGGAILVDSEPGSGTRVRVLLPSKEDTSSLPAPQTVQEKREPEELPVSAPHGEAEAAILIVDDDELVRGLAAQTVEAMGYRVITATDGEDALRVFAANADAIRCVVLDQSMPRMSGMEVFRALRESDPEVKVILCSGYSEEDTCGDYSAVGLAGFLGKPYELASLQEKVKEVLGAPKHTA